MKKIQLILSQLLLIAKDAKVWFRVLVFVIIGTICFVVGAIAFSRTKTKTQDCSYYIEQNKQLISALIDIKKDLSSAVSSSYEGNGDGIIFAQNVPKQQSQQYQQKQIIRAMNRIDSILLKIRMDSLKKIKSKT